MATAAAHIDREPPHRDLPRVVPVAPPVRIRRADIQGLRALAVLLVVAFHAGLPVSGGYTGVDVFFAISGFVITTTLLAELEEKGRIDLGRFYVRRIKRLLPALAVLLVSVALLGSLLDPVSAQRQSALTGAFASLFSANVYLYTLPSGYFDTSAGLDPLLHTWTLAVEEQFYLVFPAVLLLAWCAGARLRRSRTFALGAIGALSVASFVLACSAILLYGSPALTDLIATHGDDWPRRFAFFASPARAWEFGAGALVALVATRRRLPAALGVALGVAGLACIVLGALALHADTGSALLLPVGGACLLLLVGATANPCSSLLGSRPLVWVGDRSYSWYLWHWPLIVFAVALWPTTSWALPVAAAVSLLPAMLSYRFVENPIRLDPRIRGRQALAVACACIAAGLAAQGALAAVHHGISRTDAMTAWRGSQHLHADILHRCQRPLPHDATTQSRCTWRVPQPRGTIVLIGDSNAGHFSEPVVAAARRAHMNARIATLAACPFALVRADGTSAAQDSCTGFVRSSLAELVRMRPNLVFVASRSDWYLRERTVGLAPEAGGPFSYDATRKARLWEEGIRAVVATLTRAGVPVVIVHPVPGLRTSPQACAVVLVLARTCGGATARSTVDSELGPAVRAERAALRAVGHASTLDLRDDLCGPLRCSASRDGRFLHRDELHLSVAGALTLEDRFSAAVTRSARHDPR